MDVNGRLAGGACVRALREAFRFQAANLLRQLAEGMTDPIEDRAAARRQAIDPCAFRALGLRGTEPSSPGHSRENRVQRAGTQMIAVVSKFLEHPLAIDAPLLRMVK